MSQMTMRRHSLLGALALAVELGVPPRTLANASVWRRLNCLLLSKAFMILVLIVLVLIRVLWDSDRRQLQLNLQ
jgi:hypothetical protein